MREWGMEEGKAGKWRNEGGQAGRGEGAGRAWSEGGREDREGVQVGGEHGVREGVKVDREGDK